MPDAYIADISRRSRGSTLPDRYWFTKVDGARLREARIERGLSHHKLAADAGVSRRTMTRLENQRVASCRRATLYRIAAALADDTDSIFLALVVGEEEIQARRRMVRASATSWLCSRIFAGRPDQVGEARAFLGRVLHGCPKVYEAQLICSELVTNAIRHSRSALPNGQVTVRVEVVEHDYIWLEVEDQGGDWADRSHDSDGGYGLDVVAMLSDYWDIRDYEARRMLCVRLDWPQPDCGTPECDLTSGLPAQTQPYEKQRS